MSFSSDNPFQNPTDTAKSGVFAVSKASRTSLKREASKQKLGPKRGGGIKAGAGKSVRKITQSEEFPAASSSNSRKKITVGKRRNASNANPPAVRVTGVSRLETDEFISFIRDQVQSNLKVLESKWEGDALLITFANSAQAQLVVLLKPKKSNMMFKGASVDIKYHMARRGSERQPDFKEGVIETLTDIVQKRYNVAGKFLNLDRLSEDETFIAAGHRGFDQDPHVTKFGPVLCKIIQEQCPGIETLSLQNNKLRSVSWFSTLALRLPNLRNLSLSNNLIPNYKSLENIKGAKFLKLRELVLTGNPVYDREVQKAGNAEIYRKNICKIFPTIEILDMEPVLRVMPIIRSKYEIYGGFIDDPTTQAAAFGFLESYFTLFDAADRKALGSYYSDQAVFSLCVNVIRPNGSSTTSSGVPNLKYFSDWIRLDRNLDKLKSPERRASRLAVGPVQICSLLTDLPTTSHPIRSDPALKLFMVDAFQQNSELGALLYINIHGQMTVNNSGKKSFDRTFVLAPAAPGSRAMAKGYPVCIVNDMLVIRHFEAEPAWLQQVDRAQPGHVAPIVNPYHQLPTPEIIEQYRVACQLTPEQSSIVVEFSQISGLNYATSLDCLGQSGWNPHVAMQTFEGAKAMIPAQAFQL